MEVRGSIKSWDDDKGFGFIQPEQGTAQVFVHISAVRGDRRPLVGDSVMYVASLDPQGRMRAEHMRNAASLAIDQPSIRRKPRAENKSGNATVAKRTPTKAKPAQKSARRPRASAAIQNPGMKLLAWLALCALPIYGAVLAITAGNIGLITGYVALSLLSFYQYWSDKCSAQTGRWRTPENMLHAVELLGGWPGALVAQQVFRHKTRKVSFQLTFWLIVLLHQAYWVDHLLFRGAYLSKLLGALLV